MKPPGLEPPLPPAAVLDPERLAPFVGDGDALIIVPPFYLWNMPSLAGHVLQACARREGLRVDVLYAGVLFAGCIGRREYEAVLESLASHLIPERIFARAAFDLPLLGRQAEGLRSRLDDAWDKAGGARLTWDELSRIASLADGWADAVATAIARRGHAVVGCTARIEQIGASVALLRRVKQLRPETVTVIGGSGCSHEMAEGIASLGGGVDHVFRGEAEEAFPRFLRQVLDGTPPPRGIIPGEPCQDLDALPDVSFAEYLEQLGAFLPDAPRDRLWLAAETSRGCWWGQKHHCSFCGFNAAGAGFREKSPERVLGELRHLLEEHPVRRIFMTDNIMPHSYFDSLMPRLPDALPDASIIYAQKANLSLGRVVALRKAGVVSILPGIESLSTSVLRRMNKGVTAGQNIALLRYARAAHLGVSWNLMHQLPGEEREEYEDILALLPLLRHLPPPDLGGFSLTRFSPLFRQAAANGISNVRPAPAYEEVFPEQADLMSLAYEFEADFPSACREHPDLRQRLAVEVAAWRHAWLSGDEDPPTLHVGRLAGDVFLLHDTRGLPGTRTRQMLRLEQAVAALAGSRSLEAPEARWALEQKVGVALDGRCVPLATATPELLAELET